MASWGQSVLFSGTRRFWRAFTPEDPGTQATGERRCARTPVLPWRRGKQCGLWLWHFRGKYACYRNLCFYLCVETGTICCVILDKQHDCLCLNLEALWNRVFRGWRLHTEDGRQALSPPDQNPPDHGMESMVAGGGLQVPARRAEGSLFSWGGRDPLPPGEINGGWGR